MLASMDASGSYDEQKRIMNFSLGVAIVLLVIKVTAAAITGSAAIYSDAAESIVHSLAVCFAAWALRYSHKPSDMNHHYGHDKVAFLSAGFEGAMICTASFLILYEAGKAFYFGPVIEHLGLGASLTGLAAGINLVLGLSLLAIGKRNHSPLLQANGKHVLTDVWTSAAVLVGLALMKVTRWPYWDPVTATLAALNILKTGFGLIRDSLGGLLDASDRVAEAKLLACLEAETEVRGLSFHNFRHRHSGRTHWVEFHLVFDDSLSVAEAHATATAIEKKVAAILQPEARVITHREPRSCEHDEERWETR